MRAPCVMLVPGDPLTPTGGFTYDRCLLEALRSRGRAVEVLRIDGDWPWPDEATRAAARAAFAALPDGTCVIADGLAFGALDAEVAPHAQRLRWLGLVHHPLHLETGLDAAQARRLREQEARALRHTRQVVAVSATTAHEVAALGVPAERIAVVEPGNHLPPSVSRPATAGGVQLLCVATLTPRKDHALLLRALSGLVKLDWTLHCVGSAERDAACASGLLASTASGPLAGRVVWHGELVDAALQARYAAADVFVLASRYEGFGMVINEALLHGLPIVASRAGALASTVPAEAGLLPPAGDEAAWRDALARVISDAALRERLAGGAREAARRLPSWAEQAARFDTVMDAVMGAPQ
ncbi:glycosyltransferase family 4 protein [Hydrogenophaga intermedia]|uniref:glycosyltransferase family 4 protein n=1 Tax=Hydrogenophaga intermedia TaxID=65786 RepID=UPI00054D0743|nr:glycosyltransferase family 4 protein [Hydrogenophaga intermedia]